MKNGKQLKIYLPEIRNKERKVFILNETYS